MTKNEISQLKALVHRISSISDHLEPQGISKQDIKLLKKLIPVDESLKLGNRADIVERFKSGRPFDVLSDANECIEWIGTNLQAMIELFPANQRACVREGGGFEDLIASLTMTIMKGRP